MGVRLIPNVSNFTDEYGTRHGRWIEVDSTNMIRKEMFYSSGKLDSIYLEWKNGRVVISGFYKLGKKHGVWKYFDSKDSMFKEETYREGELIYRP